MKSLRQRFQALCGAGLDISEHLGLLHGLTTDPDVKTILEIGFRDGVSATALALAGKPLVCMDIEPCLVGRNKLLAIAGNFGFVQGNSLTAPAAPCDLLHIDSLHTHDQLIAELRRYAPNCSKWIALHDTETFGNHGKDGSTPGLSAAIDMFLKESPEWRIHLHLRNNNGLSLLKRISPFIQQ